MKWRCFGSESLSSLQWMNWYKSPDHPMGPSLNRQRIVFIAGTNLNRVRVSCYVVWVARTSPKSCTTQPYTHPIHTRTHAYTQAYVHTYTYSYIHSYIYIYVLYIYIYILVYKHTNTYIYTDTHTPTSKRMQANVPIFTHTPWHIIIHAYTITYIYINTHIHSTHILTI